MTDDPEKACKESRKRLKHRFGNSAILSADFEKRLTNWPKIGNNDAKGIQAFSDFLQQEGIARDHTPSLKIFDFSSKLQRFEEKLPGWFKTKWSTKVQKSQQTDGHGAFPSLSEFVKEVNFDAERMNIPQTKSHLVALTRELHPTSQLVPTGDHTPLQDKARKLQLYVLRQVKTESLVQQRGSQKTLSQQSLLIVLVQLQLPIQHSARITELSLVILKIARNFASSISVSEKTFR